MLFAGVRIRSSTSASLSSCVVGVPVFVSISPSPVPNQLSDISEYLDVMSRFIFLDIEAVFPFKTSWTDCLLLAPISSANSLTFRPVYERS